MVNHLSLNSTILRLSVVRNTMSSAFQSISPHFHFCDFSITNSKFSRSFSSILFQTGSFGISKITRSTFSQIIGSSIKVSSLELSHVTRRENSVFGHPEVIIKFCNFLQCESYQNGGSINCETFEGLLEVHNSVFYQSKSTDNGGSIYFYGDSFVFDRCCFDQSSSGNVGQAFCVKTDRDINTIINESVVVFCSPDSQGHYQYTTHSQSGGSNYYYCNFSNCLCERGAGSIGSFRTTVSMIMNCHITNCIGGSIIDLAFAIRPSEINKCNLVNNSAVQSTVIYYSYSTQVTKCFFRYNSKPMTAPPLGRPHSITFSDCIYDSFGLTNKKNIVINDCKSFEGDETTIPLERNLHNICFLEKSDPILNWDSVSLIYILIVSIGIPLSHIAFIHPEFYFKVFELLFFESKNAKKRRKGRLN